MQIIVTGTLLGGTYALIALGLTLQYGAARIMNLANGETLVAACFVSFWLFTAMGVNPLLSMVVIALHTAYLAALLSGAVDTHGLMLLALAAYAVYVVNAAQFVLKLRAARLQGDRAYPTTMGLSS